MPADETPRQLCVGDRASLSKTISETDIVLFANITGDTNPLHLDEEFASKTRFGGRIAHGILSLGLISAVLGTQLPGPGSVYLSQQVRFLKPVRIGDTITATVELVRYTQEKRLATFRTDCFNQDGVHVVEGEAVLLLGN